MRILYYSSTFSISPVVGGNAYYRLQLPAWGLSAYGGHATVVVPSLTTDPLSGRLVGRTFAGEVIADADVVVLQLQSADPAMVTAIYKAREAGQVVIFEIDDLLAASPPKLMQTTDVGGAIFLREVSAADDLALRAQGIEALHAVARSCDAITVSTPYLSDYFIKVEDAPPIYVIRNAVDTEAWGEPEIVTDGPTLGWTGRIEWRADDLSIFRPWLGDFLESHDLQFIHTGDLFGTSFAQAANVNPARVECRPANNAVHEYIASRPMRDVDVQLIPMANLPLTLAKSCLKGMESAACGVPFLSSPHPEYAWFDGGPMVGTDIARQSPEAWIAALEPLLDAEERSRLALKARERVASEDISLRWQDWEKVYVEVLTART